MENKTIAIKGTLIKARRESKEFRGHKTAEKFHLTLANVEELPTEIIDAFKDAGDKFTPTFVKKFEGFVNLSTKYDIPMMDTANNRHPSLEDMVNNGFPFMRAEVSVAVAVKDGALYPKAIRFLTDGEEFDPFEQLFD